MNRSVTSSDLQSQIVLLQQMLQQYQRAPEMEHEQLTPSSTIPPDKRRRRGTTLMPGRAKELGRLAAKNKPSTQDIADMIRLLGDCGKKVPVIQYLKRHIK